MKIIYTKSLKNGKRHVLVELTKDEPLPTPGILDDNHYRLGEPLQTEVVAGHILNQVRPVCWCSVSQEWVDV